MSGLSGFGHPPGMRRLPRPGSTGGSRGFVSVPGLPGRRSRCGSGPWGTAARDGCGRGVGTSVSCKVTVRALSGRISSGPRMYRAASSGAFLPGASPRRQVRRSAAPHWGAAKRPCRRPADNSLGAPCRGAGKAAAFSRHALQPRRASVVTGAKRTVKRSERASDDAVRRNLHVKETRLVRGFSRFGDQEPKSAGKCQRAKSQFFRRLEKKAVTRFPSLFARRNRMPS